MCLFLVFYSVVNFPAHVTIFLIVVGGNFVFAGGFYVTAIPCVCCYFGLLLLWFVVTLVCCYFGLLLLLVCCCYEIKSRLFGL